MRVYVANCYKLGNCKGQVELRISVHGKWSYLQILSHGTVSHESPNQTSKNNNIYIYTYTWCYPANVNMTHYRSHSNFGLVGPLISFWQPEEPLVGVAKTKSHLLPHLLPHLDVVNNANPITWTPYAKFQPDWSINDFLAGKMMFNECGNDQTTPIDTCACD